MDLCVFHPTQFDVVFRVLRTAACGTAPLSRDARAFLEAYQTIVGDTRPIDALEPIAVEDVGETVRDPHQRKRLVQLASVASMVHVPVTETSAQYVSDLSKELDTHDPVVPVLDALANGEKFRARILSARRMFRVIFKEAYRSEGWLGMVRVFGFLALKFTVNKKRLWSYKRLGLLDEGTLGREYWKHMTRVGFGFPGELNGIPNTVSYHDVSHVLNGYSTEPEGEIQQGAFQAGNRREDGFAFLQFVLLQFHQGVRLTPVAKAQVGLFDPHKVMWAVHRGERCTVDVTHQWNFWETLKLPIDQARASIGLIGPQPPARRTARSTSVDSAPSSALVSYAA
jgi:ubiquinone biosynthesis protein Coq4